MNKTSFLICSILFTLMPSFQVFSAELDKATSARLATLSKQLNVSLEDLKNAVGEATYEQKVIDSITKPWEAKPWYKYRTIFLTEERAKAGAQFMKDNLPVFIKAEKAYGVDREIIAAILGVETYFGTKMGAYKIIDSLYTLGFHYPKRAEFFSKEFANYVKLAKEQEWELTEHLGSYAGAMGMGQFMPSSYIHYAVDFNGDGKKDLFGSREDAIGSIANYFQKSKWKFHQPVAYEVTVAKPAGIASLKNKKNTLDTTWEALRKNGVKLVDESIRITDDQKVKLLALDADEDSKQYFVVFNNFISITRYNTSPLYAMAVYDLSRAIADEFSNL